MSADPTHSSDHLQERPSALHIAQMLAVWRGESDGERRRRVEMHLLALQREPQVFLACPSWLDSHVVVVSLSSPLYGCDS